MLYEGIHFMSEVEWYRVRIIPFVSCFEMKGFFYMRRVPAKDYILDEFQLSDIYIVGKLRNR